VQDHARSPAISQSMRFAEPAPVTIDRSDVGRRTVLAVAGELDLASTPDLRSAVDEALDAGAQELWVDLSDVTFIDSTCLHLMIETRRRARELNRRLAIVCPPGSVRHVFEIAGLADALPLYDDLGQAHRAT
jgi:anti-sigma B factor antagonist